MDLNLFGKLLGLAAIVILIAMAFWIGRRPDEAREVRDDVKVEAQSLWSRLRLWWKTR